MARITKDDLNEWVGRHEGLTEKSLKNYKCTLNKFIADGVDVLEVLKDGTLINERLKEVENDGNRASYAARLAGYVRAMRAEGHVFTVAFKDGSGIDRSLGCELWYETTKAFWRGISTAKYNRKRAGMPMDDVVCVDAEVQTDVDALQVENEKLRAELEQLKAKYEVHETVEKHVDLSLALDGDDEGYLSCDEVIPETPEHVEDDEWACPPAPKKIRMSIAKHILKTLNEVSQILENVNADEDITLGDRARAMGKRPWHSVSERVESNNVPL